MTLFLDTIPSPASALSRLDPRWKLAAVVCAAALVVPIQGVAAAAFAFAASIVLGGYARLPARFWRARLLALAPFLLFFVLLLPFLYPGKETWLEIGPLQISGKGIKLGLLIALKALTLLNLVLALLVSTPMAGLLHAAQRLRVPGVVILLSVLTYRYIFFWLEELARMRVALRVRGFRSRASMHSYRTFAYVTGAMLVRGSERAERIGQAMRCRGFSGRFHSLSDFRTTTADVFFFVVLVASAALVLACDRAVLPGG